jgi:hypothetical protein
MKADDIKLLTSHCPQFEPVPADLVKAFDASKDNVGIIGSIRLSNHSSTELLKILKEDEALAKRFGLFATSGFYGVFCYWFYDDRRAEQAPIVYLDQRPGRASVIANNVRELLAIVACGFANPGEPDAWEPERDPDPEDVETAKAILAALGVAPAKDPRTIVSRARGAHPDLAKWLTEQQKKPLARGTSKSTAARAIETPGTKKLKRLEKHLPKGRSVPKALVKLFEFGAGCGASFSGTFELNEAANDDAKEWFAGNAKVAKQFVLFGNDRAHSLYGYWLAGGSSLEKAPIVYLAGEGEGSTVLASTLKDFLALLGLDKPELGHIESWDEQQAEKTEIASFRAWLKAELDIVPPRDGRAAVSAAKNAFPDLQRWIDEQAT